MSKKENYHASLIASKNARELQAKIKLACAAQKLVYKPISTSTVTNDVGRIAQLCANREATQSIIAVSPEAWAQVLIQQQFEVLDIQLDPQDNVTSPLSGQTFNLLRQDQGQHDTHRRMGERQKVGEGKTGQGNRVRGFAKDPSSISFLKGTRRKKKRPTQRTGRKIPQHARAPHTHRTD